jgi:hypothetical protein
MKNMTNEELIRVVSGILIGDARAFSRVLAQTPNHKDAESIKKEIVFRTEMSRRLKELSKVLKPTPGFKEFCKGEKEAAKNYNPPSHKITG